MNIAVEQIDMTVLIAVNEHQMSVDFSNIEDAEQAANLLKASVFVMQEEVKKETGKKILT